ncbi:MAG: Ig-like domain-containing protein [Saprospiraceae bacterium]|nr:Ig-like domain-containing protein [Saprospiraceae bacterium]
MTINPPPTVSAASTTICIGYTTTLSPSVGGTWAQLTPAVATRVGNVVTGVSAGAATFRFTETSSGCTADIVITVTPRPVVSITGTNEICVGFTTQLSPTTGGTWASSNNAIATVNNAGLVTGVAVGTATFIFTSTTTLCPSLPTAPVTVKNQPVVAITGSNLLCIGQTSTLSTTGGAGTWASSNNAVATVTSGGLVTAVGPGSANFTFTETASGCVSAPTGNITVNIIPVVSFTGPSAICIGFTTQLSPASGGTWTSSDPGVATVTNAGLVTGISAGTASFTYVQTATGCTSTALVGTVNPKIAVAVTGAGSICIGGTTTLSPTTGGVWVSSNNAIATITNAGVITGVSQGTAIFTFTSTAGCPSDPITSIAIMPVPTVSITGVSNICIGTTTTLSPSTGGTWVSSAPGVATVTNAGLVTGVSAGIAQFTFTSTLGCASAPTSPITVNNKPIIVLNGPSSICVGKTTSISPTTGGTWVSSNSAVATINNTGLITGISVGTAKFVFTNTSTGCVSDSSTLITITTGPIVTLADNDLCIGETTTVTPSSGGTWLSSNTLVATITNAGLVTAVSAGFATFTFTDAAGCKSLPTGALTVQPRPTVSISGTSSICIGGTTTLSPSTGGTWASSSNAIATVTNGGVVTGVAVGSATFIFTSTATGCSSLSTLPVTVTAAPIVSITGPTSICVGGATTLSPSTGGTWASTNTSAAIVNNFGQVTGVGPGTATFIFTETATGCASASATGPVTVTHCFNPDFNATRVNVSVPGDVSTNDFVIAGTTYGPTLSIVLVSSPAGSAPNIVINDDGTYTFITNKIGVYKYEVPVCVPPVTSGCPRSDLTINVVEFIDPDKKPVANVDIATTSLNTPVILRTLSNDACVVVTGCTLDPALVTISIAPNHGSTSINLSTGDNTYTPTTGFVGLDTLTYQVCVTGEPANCATAKQIITVNAPTAVNTTVAADDFAVTQQETAVSGNVKTNDNDPQGDSQTVTGYTTTVAAGTLVLANDGTFTFTPAVDFSGPVEFIYTTTDNNVSPATAKATLHILVLKDLEIKIRVYLEGSLMNNANGVADGRPMMRDNLRVSPFTGANYIPVKDPYKFEVKQTIGGNLTTTMDNTSKFTHNTPGSLSTKFDSIPLPSTVFAVTGQNAITDWVYVELRSKTSNTTIVKTRSGLIQRDGDVADMNGTNGLRFPGLAIDDYYVVVRHHRHLGVMTKLAQTPTQLTTLVDFTLPSTQTFDFGTSHPNGQDYTGMAQKPDVKAGFMCLWGGDFDNNRKVKADNPNDDLNSLFYDVFAYPTNLTGNVNYDFAYGYLPGDFDMNGKSKFDNPNDDKNMLYGQLLFYPLNTQLLSNFDFFIEQLP